ncbi:MAG: ComF family protein [Parcubacteria group bacterium]
MRALLQNIWKGALDYVFTKECFNCGGEGEYLCSPCFNQVKFIDEFYCFLCNEKRSPLGICPSCSSETGIDRVIIATHYTNNVVGEMIEAFKYDYLESLADILFKILDKQIEKHNLSAQVYGRVFIPIPLHRKRLAERGFNQSEELVKRLARRYGGEMRTDLLKRVKYTGQQAKLRREERFANMEGAFEVPLNANIPARVVLLDDVLTSGATFIQAARALRTAGVREVVCVAVAHG